MTILCAMKHPSCYALVYRKSAGLMTKNMFHLRLVCPAFVILPRGVCGALIVLNDSKKMTRHLPITLCIPFE